MQRPTPPTPRSPTSITYASALTGKPARLSAAHDGQRLTSMTIIEKAIISQQTATPGPRWSSTFDPNSYRL